MEGADREPAQHQGPPPPPPPPPPPQQQQQQQEAADDAANDDDDEAARVLQGAVGQFVTSLITIIGSIFDDDEQAAALDDDAGRVLRMLRRGLPPGAVEAVVQHCFVRTHARRVWERPQMKSSYKELYKPHYNDEGFKQKVRLDMATFLELRNILRPVLKVTNPIAASRHLSVGERLWTALEYFATGSTYKGVSGAVHYRPTTVCSCVKDIARRSSTCCTTRSSCGRATAPLFFAT